MAGLRELVVKLSANTVEFRKNLGEAVRSVGLFSSQIKRSMKEANTSLIGFATAAAGALSVGALAASINKTVTALADLDDMAQKTGASVNNLSKLSKVAQTFGADFGAVSTALNSLAKGMAGVDDESSKTRKALEALGISTKNLSTQDPSEVFISIAKALQEYEDGAGKAALANDLFKKAGVDLLPFLNDVAESVDKFTGATAESAANAARFQDDLGLVATRFDELKQTIVADILPTFSDFSGGLSDVLEEQKRLTGSTAFADWADATVIAVTQIIDVFDALQRAIRLEGEYLGALAAYAMADSTGRKAIDKAFTERKEDLLNPRLTGTAIRERAEQRRQAREKAAADKAAAEQAAAESGTPTSTRPKRRTLNYSPGSDSKEEARADAARKKAQELRKKQTDEALRDLQQQIDAERNLLASRNNFIELYNSQNLISIRDYYAMRKAAQQENVKATLALYDQEIAVLQRSRRAAPDEAGRLEAQSKINELLQRKIELQQQASEAAIADSIREQRAYQDLAREMRAVNAELLELRGQAGEAARIRIRDQYSGLRQQLTSEGDQEGLDTLDQLEQAKISQAEYNQLSEQGSQIQSKLRNTEESIAIARYSGSITELQAMAQISEARQQTVRELEAIVINQERIAELSGNPALINQAEEARNALEKLRAESNLLAKRFESIFVGSMGSALADFATGAKSAKEAFKDFADSVVAQITRMAAEAVAQQIFGALMGGGGAGGGYMTSGSVTRTGGGGGWLEGLLNWGIGTWLGSYNASGGTGFDPDAIDMSGSWSAPGPPMSYQDANSFPGLANGGPASANRPYYVGEFGKEIFVPNTNGRVVPHSEIGGGSTNVININQNIPRDMSRQSAQQLAADTGVQVNRAVRRNT